jgi:hypothetical protein
MSVFLLITIGLLPLSMWWCLRQYYRARRKGYHPASAATVVFGGMVAPVIAVIDGVALPGSSTWSGMLLIFPVVALVGAALVALLPRRARRAGARRSSFLSSRVPGIGLLMFCCAAAVGWVISLIAVGDHVIGTWPGFELWMLVPMLLSTTVSILGNSVVELDFARARLDAPGLTEAMDADVRPAVLYLRAFRQESDPFAWVPSKERSRYTRRPATGITAVTFEQYLGAEFTKQLGPFVALGNPLDLVPPEGAARSYAPDEDWQRHFCAHAGAAAAIVMDGSRSDNLRWELAELARNGWQHKLFLLTTPAAPRGRAARRLVYAVRRSAKGVRIPRWEQFAAALKEAGLYVPPIEPDLGSVVAFDAAGRVEVLIRCAQRPEEFVTAVRTRLGTTAPPTCSASTSGATQWATRTRETGLTTSPPEQSNITATNPTPQE